MRNLWIAPAFGEAEKGFQAVPSETRLASSGPKEEETEMGYTHYWRREKEIEAALFGLISKDMEKVCKASRLDLADGHGASWPEFTGDRVVFNGREKCGHDKRELGIAWPAEESGGVGGTPERQAPQYVGGTLLQALTGQQEKLAVNDSDVSGTWFAGVQLATRTCGGDCSHETFWFPRVMKLEKWDEPENGLYFNFTKTAYKPYDLVVTACLIVAKHYLKDKIKISSDGKLQHWFDGKLLCERTLGYGIGFELDKGE